MGVLRVAHRAGNEPALIAPALADGADLVELDVHLREGRLEVRHASPLGRTGWLLEALRPVRDPRLLLSHVREALPPGTPVMLDLKGTDEALGPGVREAMAGSDGYVVCTRHWPLLDGFADVPGVRRVTSVGTRGELARLPAQLAQVPGWGVSIHRDLLDPVLAPQLRSRVEVVMTWPVDTPAVYRRLVAYGVNGVISNDLRALPPR